MKDSTGAGRALFGGMAGAALIAILVAAGTNRAFAQHAEAVDADAGHQAAHDDHQPAGPITATKRDVDLGVWSLITFILFVFVLKKLAWGPVIEGLDKRETHILQQLADAENGRIRAEKLLAEHAAKLEKVQDEVREILAEARRDAEHTKSEIVALAQKESEAARQRAVQEIERARDQALDDLFDRMAQSVEEATEKVLGRALTGPDHERLIEEALAGVARK